MLAEIYVEAILADEELADFVWDDRNSRTIQDDHARLAWLCLASERECGIFL
jgi:hypothetical protein